MWSYPEKYTGSLQSIEQVCTVIIEPIVHKWNMNRPHDVDIDIWRKGQLELYIERNPDHKPKAVLEWIRAQSPNPWPTCTAKDISRLSVLIRKSWRPRKSETHRWDYRLPPGINIKD